MYDLNIWNISILSGFISFLGSKPGTKYVVMIFFP